MTPQNHINTGNATSVKKGVQLGLLHFDEALASVKNLRQELDKNSFTQQDAEALNILTARLLTLSDRLLIECSKV
jgi:hypothetical protein